jgi:hypothetical protein
VETAKLSEQRAALLRSRQIAEAFIEVSIFY